MKPGVYNLDVYRGDSYAWRLWLWADAARTEPLDLTGCVLKSEVRDKAGGATVVELDVTVTLPNIVDLALSAADCKLCPSKGVWDLQVTFPSGDVRTVIGGTVSVDPDVTDSVAVATARLRSA